MSLKVGDAAPQLRVSEWIKGEPLSHFERGQVYVVEFWATWCGPCIFAMPHLSEVQRQYMDKGVTVVAVNVMDEDLDAARALITKMGMAVENRVAIDANTTGEKAGSMAKAWLGENRAIPRCVIVDRDTKIAWIGHPMRVDGPLHATVAGTYDAAKQAEIDRTFEELDRELGAAKGAKQWQKVLAILDKMHVADSFSTPLNHTTRVQAFIGQGDYESASRFVKQVLAESTDPRLMGQLVGQLLSGPDKSQLDMDFVLATAMKASKNGESDDPVALSALARAFEAKGEKAASIKVWMKMLELDDPVIDKDGVKAQIDNLRAQ
ncbi:MAG: TlpA disulfide reductase family protein [Pirellulales bacterium]